MSDPTVDHPTTCDPELLVKLVPDADTDSASDVIALSSQAIFQSSAINQNDKYLDPVNYWVGMWGKLIILGAVKRQGVKQQIDPETKIRELDWESICQEILQRTPQKLRGILSSSTCCQWYQGRIRMYKEQFPNYRCHESATDHLIRHYSLQLMALNESDRASNKFYWENWHGMPSSGILRGIEKQSQKTSPDFTSPEGEKPLPLPLSSFCTVSMKKAVSKDLSKMGTSSKVDDDSKQIDATSSRDNNDMVVKTSGPVVQVSGEVHAVIEHNVPVNLPKPPPPVAKRAQPVVVEENTVIVETEPKRRKIDGVEVSKPLLLSVLWKLKEGQGLLYEMSQIVTRKAEVFGNGWTCEFTLKRIEDKIRSGEITDLNTLMNSCRCLVAMYVHLRDDRKLAKPVAHVLESLRKAAEHNLLPSARLPAQKK